MGWGLVDCCHQIERQTGLNQSQQFVMRLSRLHQQRVGVKQGLMMGRKEGFGTYGGPCAAFLFSQECQRFFTSDKDIRLGKDIGLEDISVLFGTHRLVGSHRLGIQKAQRIIKEKGKESRRSPPGRKTQAVASAIFYWFGRRSLNRMVCQDIVK